MPRDSDHSDTWYLVLLQNQAVPGRGRSLISSPPRPDLLVIHVMMGIRWHRHVTACVCLFTEGAPVQEMPRAPRLIFLWPCTKLQHWQFKQLAAIAMFACIETYFYFHLFKTLKQS